jgi:hypothetical protein
MSRRILQILGYIERSSSDNAWLSTVFIVGVGRALMELSFASVPRNHNLLSVLTSVTFYLEATLLVAWVLCAAARVAWERAVACASTGLFVGLLPPVIDVLIAGPGAGRYGYFYRPLSEWPVLLFDASVSTAGESSVLWLSLFLIALYTTLRTGKASRGVLALLLGYAVVVLLATLPEVVWATFGSEIIAAWPTAAEAREFNAFAVQLVVCMVAYLFHKRSAFGRIASRIPHVLPFIGLVTLGAVTRRSEDARAVVLVTVWSALLVVAVLAVVMLSAVVSNDALDADKGHPSSSLRRPDAVFFQMCAGMVCVASFEYSPRVGLAVIGALTLSYVYHDLQIGGKSRFPLNVTIEAGWAWCSFVAGYYCHPAFTKAMLAPSMLLAAGIFGGWLLFSGFKDYKDIRFDRKVGNHTMYTVALGAGLSLRKVHLGMVVFLVASLGGGLFCIGWTWGAGWGLIGAAVGAAITALSLLGAPEPKSIRNFLGGVTLCVAGITFQVLLPR